MKGSPAKLGTIEGTAGHRSALKYRKNTPEPVAPPKEKKDPNIGKKGLYRSDKSWKEGEASAKKAGGDLNALVKQREGLDKGSNEYAAVQNQINKALGNKKRRGVTTTTEGTTTTKTTPGIATTKTDTKRGGKKVTMDTKYESGKTVTSKFKGSGKEGEGATVKTGSGDVVGVRKAKTTTTGKGTDDKLKTKYDKSGEITKQKKTVKKDDVVTKTITKGTGGDVTKRVKTRKRGGTGLGAKIKGIFKKKDKE